MLNEKIIELEKERVREGARGEAYNDGLMSIAELKSELVGVV